MLAFLAVFLHVALPVALQVSGPATTGLLETVICAGGENKTIYLDAEGNPVEPASGAGHDCKSCLHHCAAALASAVSATAPQAAFIQLSAPVFHAVAGLVLSDATARAPPSA
jgi:hypothetical protein